MRKQIYLDIRERIESIKDANDEQLIKHVDLWNRQLDNIEQEVSFNFPAVFIEFGTMNWRTLGNRVQECELTIRLHVVTRWVAPNANYVTGDNHILDSFDIIDTLVADMQGFSTQYMNSWMRKVTITDHDHDEFVENIEEYVCNLRDLSAVKQYIETQVELKIKN